MNCVYENLCKKFTGGKRKARYGLISSYELIMELEKTVSLDDKKDYMKKYLKL